MDLRSVLPRIVFLQISSYNPFNTFMASIGDRAMSAKNSAEADAAKYNPVR